MTICTILILDEHTNKATHKAKVPSPFRSPGNNDNDLFVNPESIVTIMVESPKEPPNSDFGTSFSSPPPPKLDDPDSTLTMTEGDAPISNVIVEDIQEPIDVNTPRDTTNIFYAYEETDANVSDAQSVRVDSDQTISNESQVNNQQSDSTTDQTGCTDDVVVDIACADDAAATFNSDRRFSSSS